MKTGDFEQKIDFFMLSRKNLRFNLRFSLWLLLLICQKVVLIRRKKCADLRFAWFQLFYWWESTDVSFFANLQVLMLNCFCPLQHNQLENQTFCFETNIFKFVEKAMWNVKKECSIGRNQQHVLEGCIFSFPSRIYLNDVWQTISTMFQKRGM